MVLNWQTQSNGTGGSFSHRGGKIYLLWSRGLQYNVSAAPKRGGVSGLGETVSIRTLNAHQYFEKIYGTDLVAAEPVFSSRCRSGLC